MLLQLKNISKGYGEQGTHSFRPVLGELNLEIKKGERLSIVGPSGSGKTTLLNLIGALDRPDSGEIYFEGTNVTSYSKNELAAFRNQHLGFVFQLHHLMPQLTLWENVLLPVLPLGKVTKAQEEWAEHLIKKVGIWEQKDQKPSEMSGGECQRTAVVRSLINKPELILADEPTGNLDPENGRIVLSALAEYAAGGAAVLVVTHHENADHFADLKFQLIDGKLQSA